MYLASFPGVEEGEEKEHLVTLFAHALKLPQNSVVTMFIRVCTYTDDIINFLH